MKSVLSMKIMVAHAGLGQNYARPHDSVVEPHSLYVSVVNVLSGKYL